MSVADSISSSNVENHDHPPVNTVQETDTSPGISNSTNPVSTEAQNESVISQTPKKVCFQFQKRGICRFGVNCKFQHDGAAVKKDPKPAEIGNNAKTKKKKSTKSCFSFAKSGKCSFGDNCRFSHEVFGEDTREDDSLEKATENCGQAPTEETDVEVKPSTKENKRPKVCRYFKRGSCKKGTACNFRHLEKKTEDGKREGEEPQVALRDGQDVTPAREPTPRPKIQIQTFLRSSELTDDDLKRLQQIEIQQLKKRFRDVLEMENEDHPSIYRVVLQPTDPDWPFNLTDFHVNVSFPFEYPIEAPIVTFPEDQETPDVILSHMTTSVQEWIQAKHEMNQMAGRVELIFRPFLRWFDKNVEKLFTEGAREYKKKVDVEKAGFEFIANLKDDSQEREPTQPSLPEDAIIISKPRGQQDIMEQDENLSAAVSEMQVDSEEGEDEDEEENSSEENAPTAAASVTFDPPDKDMRGTEVLLHGLKLAEAVATLAVTRLTVTVQCARCKERIDVTTPPRRNNLITCGKCSSRQIMTFRPCLVHHHSHVIGFLDLDGCVPFDVNMVTSSFMVGCLTCSHENNLKGLQYGQGRNIWCGKCHQKMTVRVDSCRFQRLQPSENIGSGPLYTVKPKGPKKQPKDPAIVDMLPLPEKGSCKHYKKSFRWLRFPCCGKFFPCDECHDLNNDDGHEMKYATRMLCGFCAKEQPFSADKPCIRCGSSTTKGRTQHWEGGTGCRNKTKMSKSDKQKYSGVNKTVSRKAQKAEPAKKGK